MKYKITYMLDGKSKTQVFEGNMIEYHLDYVQIKRSSDVVFNVSCKYFVCVEEHESAPKK